MSAIYGIIDLKGNENVKGLLDGFSKYYSRYKVDKIESMSINGAGLGCAHQYFNEEAKNEVLPYYDEENQLIITADCVLDNRDELISVLGLQSSTPDGAVIYHSYLKWGNQCCEYLRGAFAFVIYDIRKKKVMLATDHFAQRCLFYHIRDGKLYFSTLFFPILRETGLKFEENERWLVDSITLRSPVMITEPKETAVEGVYKVVSGTYIIVDLEDVTTKETCYYNPNESILTDWTITPKQSETMIREVMGKAVKNILRNGVDIACQLSAGLDSTTVACLAAPILKERGKVLRSYTSIPLKEAGLPTKGYLMYDESEGVKKICEAYPNIVPSFVDTANRNYLKEVDNILRIWEMPCKSEQNAIWVDEIAKQAANDACKILLAGSTGNCTLSAGSVSDVVYYNLKHLKIRKAFQLMNAVKNVGASRKKYIQNMLKAWVEYYLWYFDTSAKDCYKDTVTNESVGERYHLKRRFNTTLLHSFPFENMKTYRKHMYMREANAQIGEIDTKHSLEHGVLLRDPMRTVDVVNLCFRLPIECYASDDYDRRLVREGMQGIVPEAIRHDVRHRGRQSGDNEYRISLVWDEMLPLMVEQLHSDKALKYLSKEKIDQYLNKLNANNLSDNMLDMRMLVDAYTFARYLEMLSW